MSQELKAPPYYSQWESPELVEAFLSGKQDARTDPLWRNSGAETADEYALWAKNICGMACLKMVLALKEETHSLLALTRECMTYGGYKIDEADNIIGLTYQPFTTFIVERFNLAATVVTEATASIVLSIVESGDLYQRSERVTLWFWDSQFLADVIHSLRQ